MTDKDGRRRSAVYAGEAPEYGEETFLERPELEPAGAESLFPNTAVQGIDGGAAHNWARLTTGTDVQVLDFFLLYVSKTCNRNGITAFSELNAEVIVLSQAGSLSNESNCRQVTNLPGGVPLLPPGVIVCPA
ncbi:MAG: hypothetical protein LBP22_01355 [Deltaproteobacteria bacterium]|nr:hypothetical protein [Deltaproteobacteria bacterium]